MLLASLGTSIANIALPALAAAFSASFAQVQAVVVAYLAALTVSVFIAGRLGDRYGLKPMLIAGIALFAAGALLCGVAPTLDLLIAARALQGIGAAFIMTLSMALMRATTGESRIGRAMGLLGTMSALGTALGPSLGGWLVPTAGWRSIFLAQIPAALLAAVLVVVCLPAGRRGSRAKQTPNGLPRTESAMVAALIVNILVAAVMMATLVVGPFYLGTGLGLTDAQVGLVMSVGPVISIVGGVPAGRRVDAWGSERGLMTGLGFMAVGTLLLSVLPNWIGVAGYVIAIGVLTPGYQLFQAANNTAALTHVSPDRRGTVSGLLSLSRNVGLIVGASLLGAVFACGTGTADLGHAAPAALADGLRLTFMLASALMIAAIGIGRWTRGR